MCRRIFFIFIFLLLSCSKLFADSNGAPVVGDHLRDDPTQNESFQDTLIRHDIEIANKIDQLAKKADVALSGKDNATKPNLTHIIIHQRMDWAVRDYFTYTPFVDLRLNLPNLEKKWQLKFTTYDDDQFQRGINRNRLQTTPVRQTYTGDIGFFQKLGNIDAEFEPRFEFQSGLQTSYISKFTSKAQYSNFSFFPELQLFAKSDEGVGEFLGLNSDLRFDKTFSLSFIDEEQYIDQENLFTTNLGIRLNQQSEDKYSQMYALIFESSSRTTYHLDKWTIMYGFTHKLLKNVLHYTIIPYLAYSRDYSFRGSPGVILEIDLIF